MPRVRPLLSLLILAGLLVGLMPGLLSAREVAPAQAIPPDNAVVRLYFDSPVELGAIAAEYDVWEVHHDKGYAVVQLAPADYTLLLDQGYRLEIDEEKTGLLGINAPLDARFYYFDNFYANANERYMVDFMQNTNAAYPDLTELIDIGDAWLANNGGHHRDLWVLRITNEDPAFGPIEDKPPFYLIANIHAREVTTPEMAIRYIKYLTTGYSGGGYGVDADVTWLVDWNVIYVLVSANPDGHWKNESEIGNDWRKNLDSDNCPYSSYGIDLNRNHSFFWGCCGGSSGNCYSGTFRGFTRASEPETQAFQNHFAQVMLDQNGPNGDDEYPPAAPDDTIGIFITLHTYSDLVLWPYGHTYSQAPNAAGLQTIGRKFAYYNNYTPQQAVYLYPTDGTTDEWAYGKFGVPSYTFEIGPQSGSCGGFFPNYGCMEGIDGMPQNFWAENRPAFIFAHKIARTPYMTSYGPDTQNVSVSPVSAPRGQPVELTAFIQDHRYGGDPLAPVGAAEYFIGAPGVDGTGLAMTPQDGDWGDTAEWVEATVDTAALEPGDYYILVHGKKQSTPNDYWGPFTAVFLTVEPPAQCDPVQILDVLTEAAGCSVSFSAELTGTAPFAYDWDFGAFGASSDPSPTAHFGLPGTYPYTLTVSNCYGQQSDTYQDTVTVDCCVPPSDAGLSYDPPAPVAGESVVFTGTAVSNWPLTYAWDFGDGAIGSGAVVTHSYAAGGAYEVTLVAENDCGAEAVTATVSVCAPAADAAFTWTPLTPTAGDWVAFRGTASGSTPISYAWDFGDGGRGSGANVSHKFTAAGLYTVVMTATNCGGHTSVTSNQVTVLPVGGCDLVEITDVATLVAGCTVDFAATLTGDPPYTYLWAFGDGATSALAAPTHTYAQTGAYSATLEVWNCAGAGHDTYDFTVEVECAAPTEWRLYLPLIVK